MSSPVSRAKTFAFICGLAAGVLTFHFTLTDLGPWLANVFAVVMALAAYLIMDDASLFED